MRCTAASCAAYSSASRASFSSSCALVRFCLSIKFISRCWAACCFCAMIMCFMLRALTSSFYRCSLFRMRVISFSYFVSMAAAFWRAAAFILLMLTVSFAFYLLRLFNSRLTDSSICCLRWRSSFACWFMMLRWRCDTIWLARFLVSSIFLTTCRIELETVKFSTLHHSGS